MSSRGLRCFLAFALAGCGCLSAQSKRVADLGPGKILVTPRESPDPLFTDSVVLLVRFDETGALGLMLNRRTNVPISRALKEFPGAGSHPDPVFVGGPVQLDTVLALARSARSIEDATKIFGSIYLITAKTSLQKALEGTAGPGELRLYLGYCGWAPHQLESEVSRGGWYIFNQNADLPFDAEPAKLWQKLIRHAEDLTAQLRQPSAY